MPCNWVAIYCDRLLLVIKITIVMNYCIPADKANWLISMVSFDKYFPLMQLH